MTRALTLNAGFSWLHARYGNFKTATGTDTRIDTQTEQNSSAANPQDWSGLQAIRSPNFSGSLGAAYTAEAFGGKLVLSGNAGATTSYVPEDNSVI